MKIEWPKRPKPRIVSDENEVRVLDDRGRVIERYAIGSTAASVLLHDAYEAGRTRRSALRAARAKTKKAEARAAKVLAISAKRPPNIDERGVVSYVRGRFKSKSRSTIERYLGKRKKR